MQPPDQRLFEADLSSADFRSGVLKGWWGEGEAQVRPDTLAWPSVILWIDAAERQGAPDRYHLALNCAGYRTASPTGAFWDPTAKTILDKQKWPKGKPNSRFAKVFRTDTWQHAGRAFYHPYDRVAISDHRQWHREQPHLVWDDKHTIVDYLEEFRALLQSGEYLGV